MANRNSLNGILHVQKQFLSIVNVSHNELIKNRDAINNLTHSMHELKHWVARILVNINEYVHGIITYNRISEQVLRITQHVDLYEDLVRVQELQRAALETGNLQERLLPRHILEELTTLPEMSGEEESVRWNSIICMLGSRHFGVGKHWGTRCPSLWWTLRFIWGTN